MKSFAVLFVSLVLAAFLAGCAVNYDYRSMAVALRYAGTGTFGVAVHDRRAYVLSGEKGPDFVGLARGGFGNPFSRATLSGHPLADDMNAVITAALARKGFQTISLAVAPSTSPSAVVDIIRSAQTERSILLTVDEWKSDLNPYRDVTLFFDLKLVVFDRQGKILAAKEIAGRDDLGSDFWAPAAYARKAAPAAFKNKIEKLLNDPEVVQALQ